MDSSAFDMSPQPDIANAESEDYEPVEAPLESITPVGDLHSDWTDRGVEGEAVSMGQVWTSWSSWTDLASAERFPAL